MPTSLSPPPDARSCAASTEARISTGCSMTDVSVMILDVDGGDMLRACLDSVAAQTLPPREVIVFDNGSRIPAAERVAFRPGLHVFRSETNLGFAGGNNEAYRHVTGAYVALINNDVVLDRDWLATVA